MNGNNSTPCARVRLRLAAAVRRGVLVFVLACFAVPTTAQQPGYVVGPQDVLSIAVFDGAELSGRYTVEADGGFTFPMLGRIKAGGRTLRQLEEDLKTRLAVGFFRNPQVSLTVEQYRSQRVFVVGEVRQAGTYPLTGDVTLIEALSRAGSTTAAAGGEAIIVRAPPGRSATSSVLPNQADGAETLRVNLYALQQGNFSQNIMLRDGDTIFVPRADTIYISGQVRSPGAFALQTRDTTVQQALTLAGGATERGSTGRITISRLVNDKKVEIKVKLTDIVQPGDTIVVPRRFF
jgi:polysaccharide export outer membrane protein